MKTPSRSFLLLLAALTATGLLPAGPRPLATLSDATRQRIEALLGPRLHPAPLPVNPPNPFLLASPSGGGTRTETTYREPAAGPPGGAPVPEGDEETPPEATTLLARYAARLRIGGMIRLNNQFQIIVNDVPWKEGELIPVDRNNQSIRLKVVQIQPGQLTLRLDDAELVIRF